MKKRLHLIVYKGELKRDYFFANIFVCNCLGMSFRIMGYGFTLGFWIRRPEA